MRLPRGFSRNSVCLCVPVLVAGVVACGSSGSKGTASVTSSSGTAPSSSGASTASSAGAGGAGASSASSVSASSVSAVTSAQSSGAGGASGSSSGAGGAGGSSPSDAGTDASDSGPVDAGPVTTASVKVVRTTTLGTIGAGFAGLSYEKDHLNTGFFTPTNKDLIALFKLLGPSVLRIGGNSVDATTWDPTGKGGTAGVIGPPDVTALAGFAKAAGWTVIYGVNFAKNTATVAAQEAAAVATSLGASLYGFEIGNEPDQYATNGDEPTTFTYADFVTDWQTFRAAMHTSAPNALFTGPASAANVTTWTVPFAKSEAADIVLLTQHYYRGNGASASSTLTELLQPDPALITDLGDLSTAATANKITHGYRLAECNSFYNGGAPGISDGFGTALWVIDFLYTGVAHGSAGANFHGGGDGTGYTPIADANQMVVEVRPDYYGMLLFVLAGQGPLYQTDVTVTGVNFTAYAVGQPAAHTSIVLVNKDPTTTVEATVDLGQPTSSGALTLLTGPSLGATTGYTLGGTAIPVNGAWAPTSSPGVPVSGNTLTVSVPPASAALIRAQ